MRKLLSLTLIFTILMTLFIPMTTASTKSTTKKTTYIATQNAYKNSSGVAYMQVYKLRFSGNNGDFKNLVTFGDSDEVTFYMRGKTVYYGVRNHGNGKIPSGIYSINTDGKNKTRITKKVSKILGGYGSTIFTISGNKKTGYKIYSVVKKKIKKLFDASTNKITLFNGSIYYGNKAYVVDSGKIITFKNKGKVSSNSYMYYINSKDSLIRLDKAGKKTTIAKKVTEVLYANDEDTVIYTKGDTFYRRTGTEKACALTTKDEMKKKLSYYPDADYLKDIDVVIFGVGIMDNAVYFNAFYDYNYIVSVDFEGVKLKRVKGGFLGDPHIDSMACMDGYIYYTILTSGDDVMSYQYKKIEHNHF